MPQGQTRFRPVDGVIIFVTSIIVSMGVTLLISNYLSIKTSALVSTLVLAGLALGLLAALCGNPLAVLGNWRIGGGLAVLTIVASIALVPISLAIQAMVDWRFGIPAEMLRALLELLHAESVRELVHVWVIAALTVAIGEEIVFRGILQQSLLGWMKGWSAIVATSLVFSLLHTPWRMAPVFVLSLFLGWLYLKTRSLLPSMLAHLTVNTYTVVSVWIAGRSGAQDAIALYNESGPPPLVIVVLSVVIFALSLWRLHKLVVRNEIATSEDAPTDDITRAS